MCRIPTSKTEATVSSHILGSADVEGNLPLQCVSCLLLPVGGEGTNVLLMLEGAVGESEPQTFPLLGSHGGGVVFGRNPRRTDGRLE